MTSAEFALLAIQLALMLACGTLCGLILRRFGQPAVLGEMIGGVLLGPTVFGAISPVLFGQAFPATGSVATVRGATVKLGMILYMLLVGLEIDLSSLKKHGIAALLIGAIGTGVPLLGGVALVYAFPSLLVASDRTSLLPTAIFVGACMANSANPVLARILSDLGLLRERVGLIIMSATVVDDLVGWSLLAMLVAQFEGLGPELSSSSLPAVGAMLLVFGFSIALLYLGHRWILLGLRGLRDHLPWPSGFIAAAIVCALLAAVAAEWIGLHAFLGPFLLGVGMQPDEKERDEVFEVIHQFVMSFFVPIYFVSMGLSCNFWTNFNVATVGLIFLVACVTKIGAASASAYACGIDGRTALAIGCGLNARGAIGVILAGIGRDNHLISDPLYVALVVMAVLTSLVAGPLMQAFLPARPVVVPPAVNPDPA